MGVTVGISGARRNAAAAICVGGIPVAACEQERIIRVRAAGLAGGLLPEETIDALLTVAGQRRADVTRYAAAEPEIRLPDDGRSIRLAHHEAHAATAFLTSPFDSSAILVCDHHSNPSTTVWTGTASALIPAMTIDGQGLASVYSAAATALGFAGREHDLEAIAGLADGPEVDRLRASLTYCDPAIRVAPDFAHVLDEWSASWPSLPWPARAALASSLQRRVGQLLLDVVADARRKTRAANLCLGGGLFYNTYLTTIVAMSGIFERVFVPDNPGNGGLAVGAAMAADRSQTPTKLRVSSFLGPGYSETEIKATLDNCKLSYSYLSDRAIVDETVDALQHGALVGWFDGRMEWGHRALGNRSILASPLAPYALENLNVFLKHRPPWRRYGLAASALAAEGHFEGPPTSDRMEYEYVVRNPEALRGILPQGASRLRVQTVPDTHERFGRLLEAVGEVSGLPALVNTSFNGFHEPIVCSPRDAVRVFYGTGLDLLVMGRFLLRK